MSSITERRIVFDKFTHKDALAVLSDWHATMISIPATGDFQLRLDLKVPTNSFGDWFCLNVYKNKNLTLFSEHRNGFISPVASQILLPSVKEVVVQINPTNPDKSKLIFESENHDYSITNKGLRHILSDKEGKIILNREFENITPHKER